MTNLQMNLRARRHIMGLMVLAEQYHRDGNSNTAEAVERSLMTIIRFVEKMEILTQKEIDEMIADYDDFCEMDDLEFATWQERFLEFVL